MKHHKREAWLAARASATNRHEMAQILNVDIRSVSKLLSYYNVPSFGHSRKYSDEYCKKIADRFLAGESMRLLAEAEGLTEGKIAGILTRAGAFKSEGRIIKFIRPAKPAREKIIRNFGTRITTSFEPPAAPFVPRAADIVPLNIPLLDLEWRQCREPYGDDPATMTFCGHTAEPGKPYCLAHCRVNYRAPEARNRAPRPR